MTEPSAQTRQGAGSVSETYRGNNGDLDPQSGLATVNDQPPAMNKATVNVLLAQMVKLSASDLHLSSSIPPSVRLSGELVRLDEFAAFEARELREMIYAMLTQRQRERFEEDLELDGSYSVPGIGRFRYNIMQQRGSVGAVFRYIPFQVPPLESLGLPPVVEKLASIPRGLVLVTGPTGSGKSTTLASILDRINSTRKAHIVTIEDPIEFLHSHKMSLVNQREVGADTKGFSNALRHVLRQDPDIILVGEMRDLETISSAITAAETGHYVLASLHTQDAPQAIDRMVDVFPSYQQQQIRVQLASTIQAIVTQQLLPVAVGSGRKVATEILVATPAVRNLIREAKTHQIYSSMQSGAQYGMCTMDNSLAQLVKSGEISLKTALTASSNPEELRRLIGGK